MGGGFLFDGAHGLGFLLAQIFFFGGTAALDSDKVTLIKGSNDIVTKKHRSEVSSGYMLRLL